MKPAAALLALLTALTLPAPAYAAPQSSVEGQDPEPAQPDRPAPDQPPPPPPSQRPEPPSSRPEAPPREIPDGQWVYTDQYGWVWMPYGDAYAHVPADGGTPLMYVYYPVSGWCWVVAPWIWGWGPHPFFGVLGWARFGWWGWGFGHWYGFAGPYGHWGRGGWGYHAGGRWNYRGPHGYGGSSGPHGYGGTSGPHGYGGSAPRGSGPHGFAGSRPQGPHFGSGSPRGFSGGTRSGSSGPHGFSGRSGAHFGRR